MDLNELKAVVDDLVARGYGDVGVVCRDDDIEPDLDVGNAYMDEEAERFVLRSYAF